MTGAAAELDVRPASRFFKALGDETRLRIVALLSHGELCVCHLEAALALTQPTASRQLAVLKNAGVVESRRSGSWMYYRLAVQPNELLQVQLRSLVLAFGKADQLRADIERLVRAKGPDSCP